MIFFGHWVVKLWPFVGSFRPNSQIWILRVKGKFLRNIILKKNFTPLRYWKSFFRSFVELFLAGLSKSIPCVQRNFWRKLVFFAKKKSFPSFLEIERKICGFCGRNMGELIKTAFFRYQGTVSCNELSKKNSFHIFSTLGENFSAFCQKKFGRVVKRAFYVSIETFWRTNFHW